MKKIIENVMSAFIKIRQANAKANVKLAEFDYNVIQPFGAGLASRLWNVIRIVLLPFASALILSFTLVATFKEGLNLSTALVYFLIICAALSLSVVSLMLNVVRGELRYCREREEWNRSVSFYSFSEMTKALTRLKFTNDPAFAESLKLHLNSTPYKAIWRYLGLFFVLPVTFYSILLVPSLLGLGVLNGVPQFLFLMAFFALFVCLIDRKINIYSDPAYLVMSSYRHEDVRRRITNIHYGE